MSFLGIENTNEFFTLHYLTAILQGDLRPVLDRWRAAAKAAESDDATRTSRISHRAPPQALAASHREFFRYLDRLEQEPALEARVAAHFEMVCELLVGLGYADVLAHRIVELPSGHVALYGDIKHADGSPVLWVLPVVAPQRAEQGTLATPMALAQLTLARAATRCEDELRTTGDLSAEELVSEAFNLEEPPRFILVVGLDDVILVERAKWAEQRLLRFELREILGRRQAETLDVTAALLHRESLVPSEGVPLLDDLDDHSHKHAFAVSEDLKYALQASIERLGNAAVDYIRKVKKQKVFGEQGENELLAEQLSRDCLRYMYRLLFLFYIEARPELGYAPMGATAYQLGYSLERLRDLEQLDLSTEEARNGMYIHRSLRLLFDMIYNGCQPARQVGFAENASGEFATSHFATFELAPLRSRLFDPAFTPLLDGGSYDGDRGVVFSNDVLRDVIENMSLTRSGARGRRGRISYATLGINQLGAVYEALLSFHGFLAKTDLYEVKPEKSDSHSVLDIAYFVPEQDLPKYSENERVYDGNALKKYTKGTFIYRLAGRDRQSSASYYTPEVLTRATVKYALKELLGDELEQPKLTADEILRVTVCEPAMGSAAFLNEAVNQLAEVYLSAKQRERGERIPHDDYAHEKQCVKMFIADNNVFGVDLNPVAVELAQVSLWLNTIHKGGFVPWFTGQTVCGNSLVGARKQVFLASALDPGIEGENNTWLDTVPERVPLGAARPEASVYHFLLGDRSMSVYGRGTEGEPIREMAKQQLSTIDRWRTGFCAPLEKDEIGTLGNLTVAIDGLWHKHADLLKRIRYRTTDPIQIYGQPPPESNRKPTTTADKDRIWAQEMLSETVRASSPYRRLKLVMDYWCALWFWPIERAELLPTRDEFLEDLRQLLDTDVYEAVPPVGHTLDLFPSTAPEEAKQIALEYGLVNVHTIVAKSARLQLVEKLAERYRFLHWELEFADVFTERGGFDLILGNPPWIRVRWAEEDFLSTSDPSIAIKKRQAASVRDELLARDNAHSAYQSAHEAAESQQGFLSSRHLYPLLSGGVRTNLYKNFIARAWLLTRPAGVVGFLHPEGVYEDPNGAALRGGIYLRLRKHFQFINEKKLFEDVDHHQRFSINIYADETSSPRFENIANLFAATTIDESYQSVGTGAVPGIKDLQNEWETRGHRDRVVTIAQEELEAFSEVYGGTAQEWPAARLPVVHSGRVLIALERFRYAKRLKDLESEWADTNCFHETHAQRDGTILKETGFPTSIDELVLSGPHFFVSTPLYKTARRTCTHNSHYDVVDLSNLPENYLPRTNYRPALAMDKFRSRTPGTPWNRDPVSRYARVVVPKMVAPAGERTLQPALMPAGPTHIDGVNSYVFRSAKDAVFVAGAWSSLPADFFVKSTGEANLQTSLGRWIPIPTEDLRFPIVTRALILNCVTTAFVDIWRAGFVIEMTQDAWARSDTRLDPAHFRRLSASWSTASALRSDFSRRQALVELDVLVARAFGMTCEELREMYRSEFFVLRSYELDTWYDRRGRIVFTNSKGLVGVGLPRTAKKGNATPAWNDVKDMQAGTVSQIVVDDTLPGGPRERTIVYEAPFDRCDRERDYEIAWAHFEKRFGGNA